VVNLNRIGLGIYVFIHFSNFKIPNHKNQITNNNQIRKVKKNEEMPLNHKNTMNTKHSILTI